ncbi:ABC transporter substrate-binding protein [Carnobacterium maltaromaticum]|uniref:ABC transporter substrate-binding protein n=1 Tax=Carnobacterium maltaromaticum TaxID=2751 RepID=UPI00295F04D1|nr:ABC transporter substrate-binding protein [Carnobacterium maltaromaticum]
MRMKQMLIGITATILVSTILIGCNSNKKSNTSDDGKTTITFWAAPNPTQLKYWQEIATEFEKQNTDIHVDVTQMKESPSSEATIQSALASNTAPTLSENINRSFAAQLADSKALVPLNTLKGTDAIVAARNMEKSFAGWKFSDGNQYVFPVYSNPILFAWRTDVLKELGYAEPPKTYSELLDVGKKLKATYPDKVIWAKSDLSDPTAWMRWFDFFPLYNAASDGNKFIDDNQLITDNQAGKGLLTLMSQLQKEDLLLTGESTDPFENQVSIMADMGPWTFPNWAEKYPELTYGENYTITSPVVPDKILDAENIATYADTKGVVLYAQATDAEQKAAIEFLQFAFEDVEHDVNFLETTSLIPARDDATKNPAFATYFTEHPELAIYAANVPTAIPAMDNAKYNDLQQIIGEQAWNPIVRGEKTPNDAWNDMTKALKGVLQ